MPEVTHEKERLARLAQKLLRLGPEKLTNQERTLIHTNLSLQVDQEITADNLSSFSQKHDIKPQNLINYFNDKQSEIEESNYDKAKNLLEKLVGVIGKYGIETLTPEETVFCNLALMDSKLKDSYTTGNYDRQASPIIETQRHITNTTQHASLGRDAFENLFLEIARRDFELTLPRIKAQAKQDNENAKKTITENQTQIENKKNETLEAITTKHNAAQTELTNKKNQDIENLTPPNTSDQIQTKYQVLTDLIDAKNKKAKQSLETAKHHIEIITDTKSKSLRDKTYEPTAASIVNIARNTNDTLQTLHDNANPALHLHTANQDNEIAITQLSQIANTQFDSELDFSETIKNANNTVASANAIIAAAINSEKLIEDASSTLKTKLINTGLDGRLSISKIANKMRIDKEPILQDSIATAKNTITDLTSFLEQQIPAIAVEAAEIAAKAIETAEANPNSTPKSINNAASNAIEELINVKQNSLIKIINDEVAKQSKILESIYDLKSSTNLRRQHVDFIPDDASESLNDRINQLINTLSKQINDEALSLDFIIAAEDLREKTVDTLKLPLKEAHDITLVKIDTAVKDAISSAQLDPEHFAENGKETVEKIISDYAQNAQHVTDNLYEELSKIITALQNNMITTHLQKTKNDSEKLAWQRSSSNQTNSASPHSQPIEEQLESLQTSPRHDDSMPSTAPGTPRDTEEEAKPDELKNETQDENNFQQWLDPTDTSAQAVAASDIPVTQQENDNRITEEAIEHAGISIVGSTPAPSTNAVTVDQELILKSLWGDDITSTKPSSESGCGKTIELGADTFNKEKPFEKPKKENITQLDSNGSFSVELTCHSGAKAEPTTVTLNRTIDANKKSENWSCSTSNNVITQKMQFQLIAAESLALRRITMKDNPISVTEIQIHQLKNTSDSAPSWTQKQKLSKTEVSLIQAHFDAGYTKVQYGSKVFSSSMELKDHCQKQQETSASKTADTTPTTLADANKNEKQTAEPQPQNNL